MSGSCRVVSIFAFALCLTLRLAGQTVSTEILGLVSDQTGAVIPGATIRAKRVATGDARTTATNETGNYVFPLLEIGEYEVTCTAQGFKTEIVRGIVLQLQQKERLDFRMSIGEQVQTLEIQGFASMLRTEDATLGSVIESKRVVELPLNGRNFAQLATLMPGVTYGTSRIGVNGQGGTPIPGQTVQIAANGQRDIQQRVTLDGVVAVEPRINTMSFTPSIEAIEEFKVQSAVYSAEYGMNSGAQVNVAVKSGTNQLHATLFEFVRNDLFDARGFFLPPSQPKNKLRRNQYGVVASGPVIKDKTFWLFNWEARRERRATPNSSSVPTLAMRAGDFSELLQPHNRWYPGDANPAATRAIRSPGSTVPFPGNIIPPSLINPVSRNVLTWKDKSPFPGGGFLAPPNIDAQALAAGSPINYARTDDLNIDSNQFLARLDHKFRESDRVFGRYVIVNAVADSIPLAQVNRVITDNRSQNAAVGWTRIFTPTVLNDFRYGYNRTRTFFGAPLTSVGFDQKALGLDFRVVGDHNRTLKSNEEGLPMFSMDGYLGIPYVREGGQFDLVTVHEYSDNLSVTRGKHNFKFGGLYSRNIAGSARANVPRGALTFTRDITGIPDSFAEFLLGYPTTSQSAEGQPPLTTRQNKFGLYWTDDFKATPRLTINYGLRWDVFGHVVDQDNLGRIRTVSFANGKARVINGVLVPMLIPNPGDSSPLYDINRKQIMPRLGIAWRATDKMVLRVGAGQFYNANQMNNFQILNLQPPLSGSSVISNDRQNPKATIDNPFAGQTGGQSPTALLMLGNLQASHDNRSMFLNNNIWQWTFEIERSFGANLVTGIGYVGNKGTHLDQTVSNYNNPTPGLGNIQSRRPVQSWVDSLNPDQVLPLSTLRYLDSSLNSIYHALQARAEKRYSQGLTFAAAFNYQKALGVGYSVNESGPYTPNVPQDPRNIRADRGRFALDQRFRFVLSNVWELPVFRGQKGFKGALLKGWAINGIVQLTSGFPVTVTQSGDSQNTGAASAPRPNVLPGAKVDRVMSGRTLDHWFNTGAFVRSKCDGCPGDGTVVGPFGYGDAGVTLFESPAEKTWDFALFKEFRVAEQHRLQFRWEAFNFFNTPQFGPPAATFGNSSFGRITSTATSNREIQFGLKYRF